MEESQGRSRSAINGMRERIGGNMECISTGNGKLAHQQCF